MVDADRPGASLPPALPRSRRLRCPSGRGRGSAPQGSSIVAPTAARSRASTRCARPRLANGDWPDAGHDLALRKMAMAHYALLARLGLQIGMLCEKLSNLCLDRLGQQSTRAAAHDLCQGIVEATRDLSPEPAGYPDKVAKSPPASEIKPLAPLPGGTYNGAGTRPHGSLFLGVPMTGASGTGSRPAEG